MTDTDIVSLTVSGAYLFAGTVQNPGIPSAGVWSIALFGLPNSMRSIRYRLIPLPFGR